MQCIFKSLQLSKIVKYNSFFFFSDARSSQVSDTVFGFISSVSRIVPSPAFSFVYFFTEEKLGDLVSIPASGRSPGEGNTYPLQYPSLENYMGRRAWQAIVHCCKESDMTEQLSLS